MMEPSLVQRADSFADEAIGWFAGHRPFVEKLTHARRVQARLMALGVHDEDVLAAARLFPIFPVGQINMPLISESMAIGDQMAEATGLATTVLAQEVAALAGYAYGKWPDKPSSAALVILQADDWGRRNPA